MISKFKLDTLPFDDNKMTYDFDSHRYVLDMDNFNLKNGVVLSTELGSESSALEFLDSISEQMYNFVYDSANFLFRKNNIKIKEYKMAKDYDIRDDIFLALNNYAKASLRTDIDLVGDEQKINVETGARIDIRNGDDIPIKVIRALNKIDMLYSGNYKYEIDDYRVGY